MGAPTEQSRRGPPGWKHVLAGGLLALGLTGVLASGFFLFTAMDTMEQNAELNRQFRATVGTDYPFQYLGETVLMGQAGLVGLVLFVPVTLGGYFWLRKLRRLSREAMVDAGKVSEEGGKET